jgi:hypothetical protein
MTTHAVSKPKSQAQHKRVVKLAKAGDQSLGPLKQLPGVWSNEPLLTGRGWNCIALPFIAQDGPPPAPSGTRPIDYRLLCNQFNETLKFDIVDDDIPNRGIDLARTQNTDELVVSLDYEQGITQIAAEDSPVSGLAGTPDTAIHHEPGLFLYTKDHAATPDNPFDVARLGTIPHGDALLALGRTSLDRSGEGPSIPAVSGLPIGGPGSITSPYLAPYQHFHQNLFRGIYDPTTPASLLSRGSVGASPFTGTPFDPAHTIKKVRTFEFDTTFANGGIHNVPFVISQANATEMRFTLWLIDLVDAHGNKFLVMQYLQVVFLDFFDRFDGQPGQIRWPHVSINTMVKVRPDPTGEAITMPHATTSYPTHDEQHDDWVDD